MIDLFDLYKSFRSYANTFQGGWFRPQTDFETSANDISFTLWNEWTDQAEKDQEVKDNLIPFLISEPIAVKETKSFYGIVPYPSEKGKEYKRFSSARIVVIDGKTISGEELTKDDPAITDEERTESARDNMIERQVDLVDNKRWAAVNEHMTKKPTLLNPKMSQFDQGFRIAPRSITNVVLDFYRAPKKAVFAYTIAPGNVQTGAGDQIIYNKKDSEPLEWPDTVMPEFIIRLGERFGIFTRDQFMTQVSKNHSNPTSNYPNNNRY